MVGVHNRLQGNLQCQHDREYHGYRDLCSTEDHTHGHRKSGFIRDYHSTISVRRHCRQRRHGPRQRQSLADYPRLAASSSAPYDSC